MLLIVIKTQPRIAINSREKSTDYKLRNNDLLESTPKNSNITKGNDEVIEVVTLSSEKPINEFQSVSEVLNASVEDDVKTLII